MAGFYQLVRSQVYAGWFLLGATLAFGQASRTDAEAFTTGAELNNRGVELRLASQPAEAIAVFNRAIKVAETTSDDRLLATALGGLGAALMDAGEYARAQPVLRRSLALFEKTCGGDSIETGEAANNLAMVYRKSGNLAQAQAQQERALPLMERYLDPHSQELEIAFNNMFIVLVEQKRWDQAEPYLRRALDIADALLENAAFPENSTSSEVAVANIKENLALLQAHRNQFRDAAQTMRQVVAIEERALGPGDSRLAGSLESYAAYLKKSGQTSEARVAEDRARSIRR